MTAPLARSCEKDWLAVQAGYLKQLKELAAGAPVVVPGDLFDRWDSPAELINFAMEHLPEKVFAVPGNHELPYHRYGDRGRSAYWTLVAAGRVVNLSPGSPVELPDCSNVRLHGFPCGVPLKPLEEPHNLYVEVAVVHAYVWRKGKGYPGAPPNRYVDNLKGLKGYDGLAFGDNHQGFLTEFGKGRWLLNCGTFIRRKADEYDYEPQAGLLMPDGSLEVHKFDTSKDQFLDEDTALTVPLGDGGTVGDFIDKLKALQDVTINFEEFVVRELDKRAKGKAGVKRFVLAAMEEGRKK